MSRALNWERASSVERAGIDNRLPETRKAKASGQQPSPRLSGQRGPGKQAQGNRFATKWGIVCFGCHRGPRDEWRAIKQVRWQEWGVKPKPWIVCEDCVRRIREAKSKS